MSVNAGSAYVNQDIQGRHVTAPLPQIRAWQGTDRYVTGKASVYVVHVYVTEIPTSRGDTVRNARLARESVGSTRNVFVVECLTQELTQKKSVVKNVRLCTWLTF